MAYSSVGRPVFYIDNYLYHKTIGTSIENNIPEDVFTLSPAISKDFDFQQTVNFPINPNNYDYTGNMKYYIALLNHNFGSADYINFSNIDVGGLSSALQGVYNDGYSSLTRFSPLNGSSIFTSSLINSDNFILTFTNSLATPSIGAISMGIQYTMPHSPDLKLSMEIEMDGIDTTTTSGGGTISNVKYTGNPLWVNGNNRTNCFDVYEDTLDVTQTGARRNGRKSWNLKFSYMSETDLFSSNPRGGNYTEHPNDSTYNDNDLSPSGGASDGSLAFNIETDDSFYAQVWNKTLGLPFIFVGLIKTL